MNEVFKTNHPLFKEINTKFLTIKLKSDKKFFSVGFNDSKTKLIINNGVEIKEYDVREGEEKIKIGEKGKEKISYNSFKYIHPDNIEKFDGKDKNKICRIIENDGINDYKFSFKVELNENKTKLIIDDGNESKEYNISKKEDKKTIYLLFKLIYPKNTEKLDEEIIFRIIENIELNNNKKVFSVKLNNNEKNDENNKKFDIELNNDKTKLTITNNGKSKEYDVFEGEYKEISYMPFRYIHPKNKKEFNPNEIFIIIENDDQLNSFNNKNFDRCIFLEKFCPLSTSIDFQKDNPSFQYSIFKDGCIFDNREIINSNFQDCIFFGWAYFQKSIFKNAPNKISPFPYTTFSGSVFLDHADFIETKFESDACFNNCIFKDADFNGAEFKQYTSFYNSKFLESLYLSNSKINNIILENANIKKLHLTDVEIKGSLNCDKIKLQKKENEEAFSILKEMNIKKYNSISALYLHKKEVEEYRCTLDWKKNFIEKFILSFEKIASNYGTNPFLAMGWLLLIHSIDYFIRDCCNNPCNELEGTNFNIYKLNIIEFMESGLGIWFLIKIISSSILIYEIIKSFRMFSRKL